MENKEKIENFNTAKIILKNRNISYCTIYSVKFNLKFLDKEYDGNHMYTYKLDKIIVIINYIDENSLEKSLEIEQKEFEKYYVVEPELLLEFKSDRYGEKYICGTENLCNLSNNQCD